MAKPRNGLPIFIKACANFCPDKANSLFFLPKHKESKKSTATCEVKAFVEATPISGPAWV